jgi:hypothetical protein
MASKCYGPTYHPINEYRLGVTNMIASMKILKSSDMWIADSRASNYVTFLDIVCINRLGVMGL